MKKNIIITILLSLYGLCISFAQNNTNYYLESKTFTREDYTYQCDVTPYKLVTLYNKGNTLTYEEIVYKSTQKVFDIEYWQKQNVVVDDEAMCKKAWYIVNDAFTREEAKLFNNEELGFTLYIDSETGKVREVDFEFLSNSSYAQFPVEKYREIEMKLKTEIQFTPSETGKQLNYIMMSWNIEPNGKRELGEPTYIGEPIEP